MSETRLHYRTCCLCEASCGLEVELTGEQIVAIRGDRDDPLSRGYVCPKATALADLHDDPDRLRRPMRRRGTDWEEIDWEEALSYAAARIDAIQAEHGRDAVGIYIGNPTVHNYGAVLYGLQFMRTLRTKRRFSATSLDQLPHMLVSRLMYGHQLLLPVPDVDRTSHLLIVGANPLASNGSLMTAPGFRRRMKELRGRGGRVVVVDPRRTETAQAADEHVFVRPGTDAALLLAMVAVVVEHERPKLPGWVRGLDRLVAALREWTPERAAAFTGVDAGTIRRLAIELAEADRAVCYGRMGTSTQVFGSLATWGVYLLNIVSGNLDRPGGAMFPEPAVDLLTVPRAFSVGRGKFGRWRSEVRGLPEFGGELPVATMAEEILEAGDRKMRALISNAGNPVISAPNGRRMAKALESLEFMVSVDFYLNATTRHADLILPPVSPLERPHFDLVFHLFAVHDTVKYSPALFEPAPDGRHDWQIWAELNDRLQKARGTGWRQRVVTKAINRLGPDRIIDLGLRYGPQGGVLGGLTLAGVAAKPHGIDLGPLRPCLPGRLDVGHGHVELAPEPLLEDLGRLAAAAEGAREAKTDQLLLIGRRQLRNNNSWMHNLPRLAKGPVRCTLLVNPDDATRLGLDDGALVRVRSRVGEVEVPVQISDEIMVGVVSLPHGFGQGGDGARLSVAAERPGASVNDLTDELLVDVPSGNAAFNGVPVDVQPV